MSETKSAFFFRNSYYLLPSPFASAADLIKLVESSPLLLPLQVLTENNQIRSPIQKGVCIAPYFYSEYGYKTVEVELENAFEIFPVEVELFTQAEYNAMLRNVILTCCPGCVRYKPLSNRVQSLNGHFEEIALNSVCFYRQERKPAPRVFRDSLFFLGGFWKHFDPCMTDAARTAEEIKSRLYIKFDTAEKDCNSTAVTVAIKPDFYVQSLSALLAAYVENVLSFTDFRIRIENPMPIGEKEIRKQLDPENREAMQKQCKKYGVALAELTYSQAYETAVNRSLKQLFDHYYIFSLSEEPGRKILMLLDECTALKELHFRAPLLETADATITVYNQNEEKTLRITFDMQKEKK